MIAKNSDTTFKDGILIPRISGADLKNKTYTTTEHSALIFVTTPLTSTDLTGQVININKSGFYYFDGGSLTWKPIDTDTDTGNIYSTDGTLSGHRTVTQGNNRLLFTDTFPAPAGTDTTAAMLNTSYNSITLCASSSSDVNPSELV